MRKLLLAIVGIMFVAALVVGCGGGQQSDAHGDKLVLAVIPKGTGAEFWNTVELGVREAAEEFDVEIRWEATLNETEIPEQKRIIESMVNLGVDGMALAPLNQTVMRKPVERVVEAGIPVVIFDSEVDGDAHVSFVATNNKQGGAMGGEHLVGLLQKEGARVMVMRFLQGTGSTEARAAGFLEAAEAAGLNVVEDPYPEDATVAGCKKVAANTFERLIRDNELELDGVFACNDRATLGVLGALGDLRDQGVDVHVKFVGFDFNPRMVDSLQSGEIDALVVQNPRKMGYLAVKTLVQHLRGEEIEKFIDTGVEVATRQRLAEDQELRQLVGADK